LNQGRKLEKFRPRNYEIYFTALSWLKLGMGNDGFLPHIHCYLDRPDLVWTMVVTDSIIGISYLVISLTLYILVRRIKLPFHSIFLAFGTFILACGATHFLEVYNLWVPNYWFTAAVKAVTAVASAVTALYLLRLFPNFLELAEAVKEVANAKSSLEEFFYQRLTTPPELKKLLRKAVYLPLALSVALSIVSFYEADYLRSTQFLVEHSTDVIVRANDLKEMANRARNAFEGSEYVGELQFAQSLDQSLNKFDETEHKIVEMVADNPEQLERIATIQSAFEKWKTFLNQAKMLDRQDRVGGSALYKKNSALFADVIKSCDEFIANERSLRNDRSKQTHLFAMSIFLTMTVLTLSLGALFVVIGRRSLLRVSRSYGRALESEKKAQEKLVRALKSRDEFFSIASHELKTPLTSLKLKLQMASRGMGFDVSNEASRRFVGQINEQINRLNVLVDDMLDLSRFRAGILSMQTQEFELTHLIRAALERMQPQFIANGMTLRFSAAGEVRMHGDQIRIEQAFTNLIVNAIKYAPNKPLHVSITKNQSRVQIIVRDEGPGIAQEDRERIFHRFERAVRAESISGLGVGLYLTKVIVEAHHGRLDLSSEAGEGATFTIDLPLRLADASIEANVNLRQD